LRYVAPDRPSADRCARRSGELMADAERIERFLGRRDVQRALAWMTKRRRDGGCLLGDFFEHMADGRVPLHRRAAFALPAAVTDWIRRQTGASRETLRTRLFGHVPTRRALVNTVRSIGRFGLTRPQQFAAPLLIVWNFTQACNLKCRHCYQDAQKPLPDELDLAQQKAVIDDLRRNDTSWVAFSGGEPMMGRNFWPVVRYAADRGLHVSVATNGTLLNHETVARLVDSGVRYIEISLDSADPATHDAFRGGRGYWERTVQGIDAAVAQEGVRVGVAATVTKLNLDELPRLIEFAIARGADTFYTFNFIPTGRAADARDLDLTPGMREEMLAVLRDALNERRISVMCTAPQMARACLEGVLEEPTSRVPRPVSSGRERGATARPDETGRGTPEQGSDDGDRLVSTGHYGHGPSKLARVMAAYVGGCGAGRCYLAVQPNGLVTPCVFMPHLVIGDYRTERLADFWFDHPVLQTLRNRDERSGHCRVFDYRDYCGGCRARALGYFGDITRSDPGCIHNQAEWNALSAGG